MTRTNHIRAFTVLIALTAAALVAASGVALALNRVDCGTNNPCYGTNGDDKVVATSDPQTIKALAGNDEVWAYPGNDVVYGDKGDDYVDGSSGNDIIYGGPGNDNRINSENPDRTGLIGGPNSDEVYGGGGNDIIDLRLFDSAGSTDYGYGGRGRDVIVANDGNVDHINCGRSSDIVYYDQVIDTIKGCEEKHPV